MKYKKTIQFTSTGMIVAEIYSDDGRCCAQEFFGSGLFRSARALENRAKKAHAWADDVIKIIIENEVLAS